jgi:hypothetical protein
MNRCFLVDLVSNTYTSYDLFTFMREQLLKLSNLTIRSFLVEMKTYGAKNYADGPESETSIREGFRLFLLK